MKPYQNKIIEKLFDIAQHVEPVNRARLSSAVVFKKEIVSVGFNSWKSHPYQKSIATHPDKIWKHAEVDSIIKAARHLTDDEFLKSELYVIRAKKSNKHHWGFGLSKPCESCMNAINNYRIRKIFYSCDCGMIKTAG